MMKQVRMNEIEMNVVDRGSGDPILFVHSFPLNHSIWQSQLDVFSESHRVIAPDLRGFGRSGVTRGVSTMDQFADDLNALLNELGIDQPITYCGLSLGGYIAWAFMRNYPDRLRSLILCDTRAMADTPEAIEERKALAEAVISRGSEVAVETMLPKFFAVKTHEDRSEIVDMARSIIQKTDPQGMAAALYGIAQRPDSTSLLQEIAIPTLLVVGVEDKVSTAEEMRTMSEQIVDSELVVIPHAGHMAPMEDPTMVNASIKEFIYRL